MAPAASRSVNIKAGMLISIYVFAVKPGELGDLDMCGPSEATYRTTPWCALSNALYRHTERHVSAT
jgi:hypothetical protein